MPLHTYSMKALPGFPELTGRRTRLRAPREGDAALLEGVVADPAGYLAECVEFLAQGDRIDWIVTTRRNDDAIGTCTLHHIDLRGRCAEIGYALHPAQRGQGFATEAAAQAMAWATRVLGVTRFEADVDPGNHASERVLARLGFARHPDDQSRFVSGSR
ncbi:GNAT family N-acetyltransferase [Lysobacter sp. KIS68-7]|uniref:GNAT family N-acetyltransferase n=1 Tax=Lysobacter sp. KIS68-7 TaxID=2904252 RepID=UPI001E5DF2DB|nr:GNAT family N-acetyltransferase [Lysobacter sp. KIS68-7]UHQ20887.1 GNAT family N-acetyltransferase [Lysobacter sp. KIS68-7]